MSVAYIIGILSDEPIRENNSDVNMNYKIGDLISPFKEGYEYIVRSLFYMESSVVYFLDPMNDKSKINYCKKHLQFIRKKYGII